MTFGEWMDTWLALYVDPAALAPSTKLCYHRAVGATPDWLRKISLEELTPIDCRRWLVKCAAGTPRAAQLDRVMLSRCLCVAYKSGLTRCVLDNDTCPPVVHSPRKTVVLTRDQCRSYMTQASVDPKGVLLLLCLCGLRRGEALGARWCDYDNASGVLCVAGQRMRVAGDYVYRPCKTARSVRALRLPPSLCSMIDELPRRTEWIVPCTPEGLRTAHRRVLRTAGIDNGCTLHGLRHTFATLAACAGEPIKTLQGILGHASYSITADLYADHLPSVAVVPAFC